VIPLRADGEIQSLQFINADGTKRFLTDGRIKGCYLSIGSPQDVIYICEGYATGASIYEATGAAVVVAFNAGNLLTVSQAIRAKYPTIKLVMCADDDANQTGVTIANEAASVVGGYVVIPDFGEPRPENATDFNDLYQLKGLEAVKLGVAQVARVQIAEPVNSEWLSPASLFQEVNSSPYPIDALPIGIRHAVNEVLEFTQCPPALAACSALSALSLATQHLANVRRAEGLTSPVSIYTLAVAESGERKTSVDKHFTSAISAWESYQAELLKDDIKRQYVNHQAWTMQFEGLKQKIKETAKNQKPVDALTRQLNELKFDEPEAIRVPRLIYGDVTPEQLAFSLSKGWPSAGVLSSEAGIVFGSHGMSGDSAMRSMSQINVLWEGGKLNIDRRTSDSYSVQDARLTMGLAVQADTVKNFFDNSKQLARGTGFTARFLIAWPDSTQGNRMYKEPPKAWPSLTRFNQRITDLLDRLPTLTDAGGIEPKTLDFTPEAKKAWIHFHDEVERELGQDGIMSDLKDVASKAADNVARIAALFHLFEYRETDNINAELVEAASDIVTWHLFEAKRFLQQIATPTHISNAIKLDAYILKYCREHKADVLSQNYILQRGPIRDAKTLKTALMELVEANRIKLFTEGKASMVQVNPELLGVEYAE
jgi:putative DNA primase/helicase